MLLEGILSTLSYMFRTLSSQFQASDLRSFGILCSVTW